MAKLFHSDKMKATLVPPEIAKAYYPDGIVKREVLTGGEINTTLLIADTNGRQTVLQRLSHQTNDSTAVDYAVVSRHLRGLGWEMAVAQKTVDDEVYKADESGKLWRSFSYIEAEPGNQLEGDLEASVVLAGLLGKLHRDLAVLEYRPTCIQDHFQDTDHYANRLEELIPKLPDSSHRQLATDTITRAREESIDSFPPQLIHGDPRIANALCKEGKPFMFIDWDTLMLANPLVDVGDLLQSIVNEAISKKNKTVAAGELRHIIKAYHVERGITEDEERFVQSALGAGRIIALNGGMRHLIDCVEDYYFGWDSAQFSSRLEFNSYAARRQWRTYEILN